jgi:hypothetical protein
VLTHDIDKFISTRLSLTRRPDAAGMYAETASRLRKIACREAPKCRNFYTDGFSLQNLLLGKTFQFDRMCRMLYRPGDMKQGAFQAAARMLGWILANLNIVAPTTLAAFLLSLLSWNLLLGRVASDREAGVRVALGRALTLARVYSEQVARAIN